MCGARSKFFCAVITSHSSIRFLNRRFAGPIAHVCSYMHTLTGQEGRVHAHRCSWGGWDWGSSQQEASAGSCPRESRGSLKGMDSGHCSHLYPFLWPLLSDPPSGQRSRHPTASWSAKIKTQTPSCQRGKGKISPRAGRHEGRAGLLRLVPRASSVSGEKGDGGVQGVALSPFCSGDGTQTDRAVPGTHPLPETDPEASL